MSALTKKILTYIVSIILCVLPGALGGIFTSTGVQSVWFETLVKPIFYPPSWVFGPVWSVLYLMIGITLAQIWLLPKTTERKKWFVVFSVQLVLNGLWSYLFFGAQTLGLAFVEIVVLWSTIAWLIYSAWTLRRTVAYLLIPYLAWVSFATLLTASLWWLN